MDIKSGLKLVGFGHCVPKKVVTNDDLSKIVDTNDEWIRSRTGIAKRHFVENEKGYELATEAARMAIADAGIDTSMIGAVVYATVRAEYVTPANACLVQKTLGLPLDIPCFDINAACSGFMFGLSVARGLLLQSNKPYALVLGTETLSKILDMSDRGSCILFGDGAGAAIVTLSDTHRFFADLGTDGNDEYLYCPNESTTDRFIHMQGQEVFKFAVRHVPASIQRLLDAAGVTADEIDYFVCHQANERIIESVAKKLNQPLDKFFMNLAEYGNTSSASIPIALSEMNQKHMFQPGMKVICVGFGGGLTWGGAYMEF